MRERKGLTNAIAQAIDAYEDQHGNVTVGEVVKSFTVLWRVFWNALPGELTTRLLVRGRPASNGFGIMPPPVGVVRV